VIATLRELAATLAAEDVTVDEFVAALGGEPVDPIGNDVVEQRGTTARFGSREPRKVDANSAIRQGRWWPALETRP
jgi:hypothetical protein